jgi:phosphoadenosine phosphosulfate reductase
VSPRESAEAILAEALGRFAGRVALACSFGGPSGMVLLDLTLRFEHAIPVYYLDTGLLFPQTYELIERVAIRYDIAPIAVRPELSLDVQAARYGEALWQVDPDRCCALRKVQPQRSFVRSYDAWLTGVRRAQSETRRLVEPFQADFEHVTKVSPLYDWTDEDVWRYVAEHDVPTNPLHFDGYPSLGCVPCTRRIAAGEDERAGRWPGFMKTECGLHTLEPRRAGV